MKKMLFIFNLLVLSIIILVLAACSKTGDEPNPELESQVAELSDQELAELGESVSKADSAIAGQVIYFGVGSQFKINPSSVKHLRLIMNEQSIRLKANICIATKEVGEDCEKGKWCECKTNICGWNRQVHNEHDIGFTTWAVPGKYVCEEPNQRYEACESNAECAPGLKCSLVGDPLFTGGSVQRALKRYSSMAELESDGATLFGEKIKVCN